jgi:uncharacterized protein (TIRG00374 family)
MKRFLPFLISAAILIGLLSLIDVSTAVRLLADPDEMALAFGVFFYIASLILRGLRFQFLMPSFGNSHIRWLDGFDLSVLVTFANHVLPFRLGETVFVILARTRHQIPATHGLLLLITVRLHDLVCLLLIFLSGSMVIGLDYAPAWSAAIVVLAILLLGLTLRMDWAVRAMREILGSACRLLQIGRYRIVQMLMSTLDRAQEGIDTVRSPATIATSFALSLGAWLCLIGCFHQFLVAFGLSMEYAVVAVGSMGAQLTTLLPVNALGNIGTMEAGWMAGFVALGMDRSHAFSSGLAIHLIVILISGLLSAWAAMRIGLPTRGDLREMKNYGPDD